MCTKSVYKGGALSFFDLWAASSIPVMSCLRCSLSVAREHRVAFSIQHGHGGACRHPAGVTDSALCCCAGVYMRAGWRGSTAGPCCQTWAAIAVNNVREV